MTGSSWNSSLSMTLMQSMGLLALEKFLISTSSLKIEKQTHVVHSQKHIIRQLEVLTVKHV